MSESFYSDLRKQCEQQQAKIERLTAALDQRHINDQCILDEAIKAATKVKDAEIERLNAKVDNWAEINAAAGRTMQSQEAEIERLNGMIETLRQLRTIDAAEIARLQSRDRVRVKGLASLSQQIERVMAENTRLKSLVDPLKMGTLR
jgi:chromosome segregation ATPase